MCESEDVFVCLSNHRGAQMSLHQEVWLYVPVMVRLRPLSAAALGQLDVFGNDGGALTGNLGGQVLLGCFY